MAQTKDETKRRAIRDAVIADVIENGLGKLSMPRIAKRASVSAGTLYVYYSGKDEMLQSIYLEVKSLLHAAVMDAQSDRHTSSERIRAMWFAMFDFIIEKPKMFAFHESIDMEQVLGKRQNELAADMARDIYQAIESAVGDGTLKPLPIGCLLSILVGPAVYLSRWNFADRKLTEEEVEATFEAIWAGIAAEPVYTG